MSTLTPGRKSLVTAESLTAALEALAAGATWKDAAHAMGARAEQTIFNALAQCKKEMDAAPAGDVLSVYWLEFRGAFGWWRAHCERARAESILALEASFRSAALNGVTTVDRDPSSNRPLVALAPAYAHLSQAQFDELRDELDQPLDQRERYLWNDDGTPVLQTSTRPANAAQIIKAVTGLIPKIYRDQMAVDLNANTQHVVTFQREGPKAAARRIAAAAPPADVVEGEFTELPAERPDIVRERERLAATLADPNRVTTPPAGVRVEVFGRAESDQPLRGDADSGAKIRPREDEPAARAPAPAQTAQTEMAPPRPSYARPTKATDPTRAEFNDSRRGMKVR